jgi:uncharacterized RDD family membrane protein YckC
VSDLGPASGIVTPEAVVLELPTAGVGSRGIGEVLDVICQIILAWAGLIALGFVLAATGGNQTAQIVLVVVGIFFAFAVVIGYPIALETLWGGRTPGKAAMGLRVVTTQGAPIRFRHAAIRGILGLVEIFMLPYVCIISTMVSRRDQRVGDLAAGTIVIRDRAARRSAVAVAFPCPPGLEPYAATLDVTSLTEDQYQLVRSFLLRVLDFAPNARQALAVRLANPIALQLRHDPPPGLNPELFLVCVASAYQARQGGPMGAWPAVGGGWPAVGGGWPAGGSWPPGAGWPGAGWSPGPHSGAFGAPGAGMGDGGVGWQAPGGAGWGQDPVPGPQPPRS